jgi:putative ABC transport system permease protein
MREYLSLVEGRWFEQGRREVVVGKAIADRYPQAQLGGTLEFGRGSWEIVGVMDGGRAATNSEIFCDVNQIAADQDRSGGLSTALLRVRDESGVQALINEIEADRRLNVMAITERNYYAQQQSSAGPILAMGTFVSIIMAIGSCFAAMNTMYAAVARRSAEIGTLRVLGFSRFGILTSFTIEALLLSVLGGLIGILLVLPLTNVSTGILSFTTFNELVFNFHLSPGIAIGGIVFSLFMGLMGGLFPAASAARKQILNALRQV